jgi:hypothetical protein
MFLGILGCTQVPRVKEAGDIIVENEKMHLAAMEQDRIFDILSKKDPTLEL